MEQIKAISVFDVLGRILYQDMSVNQKELIINNSSFSNDTYILKATLSNDLQKKQKIILK
ncbi:MAG: T9SS sorting signal type C domain-containing protein [Xanthomarina gelatinilytica]|uniref:T9SS sorting signal type C domain-containing protein n=1 Tax=Xanthomarina gelatinilytica TaxID=1137281 RepID=UPI003A8636FF